MTVSLVAANHAWSKMTLKAEDKDVFEEVCGTLFRKGLELDDS